jgi:hypothetical protein
VGRFNSLRWYQYQETQPIGIALANPPRSRLAGDFADYTDGNPGNRCDPRHWTLRLPTVALLSRRMSLPRKASRLVIPLWLCFLAFGVFVSFVTPLGEGFDEPLHFDYVQRIAQLRDALRRRLH